MPERVVRVTPQQLVSVLWHENRAQPVGLIARTIPRMRRKRNPFHLGDGVFDVVRIRQLTGFVNFDYARCVNSQREREEKNQDFESQGRSWGKKQWTGSPTTSREAGGHRRRTPLVRHGSKWYLDVKRQNVCKTEHRTLSTNELIPEREITPFLIGRPDNGYEKIRQDLERPVIIRDYAIANIAHLSLNGTLYVMDPCPNLSLPSSHASVRHAA